MNKLARIESTKDYQAQAAIVKRIDDELHKLALIQSEATEAATVARERFVNSQANAIATGAQAVETFTPDEDHAARLATLERRRVTLTTARGKAMVRLLDIHESASVAALASVLLERKRVARAQAEAVAALLDACRASLELRAELDRSGVRTTAGGVEWPLFSQPEHIEAYQQKFMHWARSQGLLD